MLLSIISVVLNDAVGLEKTILSVIDQKLYYENIEFIVVDGGSVDGTADIIEKYRYAIDKWVSESDRGIYDAMNKGIKMSDGDGLLFLNAGDFFVGKVLSKDISAPCFLRVQYTDILGRFRIRPIENVLTGLPNCHQGIIFERSKIYYDIKYRISADYKFFLDHGYRNNIKLIDTPGYIYFDNTGTSGFNYKERDAQIYSIRCQYFGVFIGLLFEIWPALKRFMRFFLN